MKRLSNPLWLIGTITIPQVILVLLYIGSYRIIGTLLQPENIRLWKVFGGSLGILLSANTLLAVTLLIYRLKTPVWVSIINLIVYTTFLYLFVTFSEQITPWNIPQWMLFEGDLTIYVFTFLMVVLIYSLFHIITGFTDDTKEHRAWKHFLLALLVPLGWYFGSIMFKSAMYDSNSNTVFHFFAILYVATLLVFLFLLLRGVYILLLKKKQTFARYSLLWKIPVCIICPIAGLLLNSGGIGTGRIGFGNFFGDFSHPAFLIISAVNGIILCLSLEKLPKFARLSIFFLSAVTYSYSIYFFLVFLPFLPLSVIAIIALGTGLLMLTPIVIMLIQSNSLNKEYKYLSGCYGKVKTTLFFLSGVAVLPLAIFVQYNEDRNYLNKMLDYVYERKYNTDISGIQQSSVLRTLNNIEANAERSNMGSLFFAGNSQKKPYLSSIYNWYVLDNLTISSAKANKLRSIFLSSTRLPTQQIMPTIELPALNRNNTTTTVNNVYLKDFHTKTTYDNSGKFMHTWINLKITNKNNLTREYITSFQLPAYSWISNYYLTIAGKKEYGIMAEKKAARWVYNNITQEQRDPGLLHFTSNDQIILKVFPVPAGEDRETGFEITHPFPLKLKIDGHIIQCGEDSEKNSVSIFGNKITLFDSSKALNNKTTNTSTPFYYFITDFSESNTLSGNDYANIISNIIGRFGIKQNQYQIYKGNYHFTHSSIQLLRNSRTKNEAGFFPEPIIRKLCANSFDENKYQAPVFILITNDTDKAILSNSLEDIMGAMQTKPQFYFTGSHSKLKPATPELQTLEAEDDKDILNNILTKQEFSPTIYTNSNISIKELKPANKLEEAVLQDLLMKEYSIHPDKVNWTELVKSSFTTRILNRLTSYIVVENEAQKAALLKKQEQMLASKQSLDAGNDFTNMSEPGIIWILLIVCLLLLVFQKKQVPRKL
jgi:hypothetical protein